MCQIGKIRHRDDTIVDFDTRGRVVCEGFEKQSPEAGCGKSSSHTFDTSTPSAQIPESVVEEGGSTPRSLTLPRKGVDVVREGVVWSCSPVDPRRSVEVVGPRVVTTRSTHYFCRKVKGYLYWNDGERGR